MLQVVRFLVAFVFTFSFTCVLAQQLSGPQRNAVRSAQNYLSFAPFSKMGLIGQLSSEFGDGYDREDAEVAVSTLAVNWVDQATKAAENYLSFAPFSRAGLIEQLSSEFGDQYEIQDAQAAVASLGVDWNGQAAKAAENYLSFSPFSCRKLVEQLSSPYGDKYTIEQATYGANQTDACR